MIAIQHLQRVPDFFGKALSRVFGTRNERVITGLKPIVERINALEPEMRRLSDGQLREKTDLFKTRLAKGETLEDILPEAFAVVREASVRTTGLRHFDVQMMGAVMLHRGNVVEMMTGEGKTLVATCPAYLNALTGRGVHVITVNDYLAARDSEWMGRIYRLLGLSVGCIQTTMEDAAEKRANYACDITYGTNNEFGFDYLRDNMKVSVDELVQRELNFAIIDEVDSILIDEARTPLIISGPAAESDEKYVTCDKLARRLKRDEDFKIDEKETGLALTEEGIRHCEEILGVDHLYSGAHMDYPHYINNALRAHNLFRLDKDYVVKGTEIVIVDEHTGRLMQGRRWSDGLHQAVEVKEGLPIKRESQTLASITFQNLFRLYGKLSGMTGTAMTEAGEFMKIYKLDVVAIPPNRPCVRKDNADLVYGTVKEKFDAVVAEVQERHATGQPVLIGTASIEMSEKLSGLLSRAGIRHEVLNAKQHQREALIIAQAGAPGAVTVATNMAGRGTDIVLGGNITVQVRQELGAAAAPEEVEREIAARKPEFAAAHDKVVALGGLFVLGSERHEARRIDNQLRGRSGRQADPGESRFYLSLEDDLMRRFAPPWAQRLMQKSGLRDGEPIEHGLITKSIANAQRKVEEYNFEIRKNLLEYDEVMNEQRKFVYDVRGRVLRGEGVSAIMGEWVADGIALRVAELYNDMKDAEDKDQPPREFRAWVEQILLSQLPADLSPETTDAAGMEKAVRGLFEEVYRRKGQQIGPEATTMIERYILLNTIDHAWKEHLYNMDHVKDSIGWRGYAQVDPKVEYKKEAYAMFRDMLHGMKRQVASLAVRLTISRPEEAAVRSVYHEDRAVHNAAPQAAAGGEDQAKAPEQRPAVTAPIVNRAPRQGRNDPCACGSGKKHKSCCGRAAG